jgi:hypothetical protein
MEECLQVIDERKECPNDDILVQQVRLQLVVEKMALSSSPNGGMESTEHSLYIENLRSQLLDIKANILARSEENGKLSDLN